LIHIFLLKEKSDQALLLAHALLFLWFLISLPIFLEVGLKTSPDLLAVLVSSARLKTSPGLPAFSCFFEAGLKTSTGLTCVFHFQRKGKNVH